MMISLVVSSCRAMMKRENVFECSYADEWGWERYSLFEVDLGIHNEDGKSAGATSNKLMVAGNPVKKILLKLNLSDHRSILTDSKVTPTKPGRMTKPYSSPRFIANCFNAGYLKMEVEVPDSS
ncbi:hypothetical protein Tco_1317745 [Tanacetum coccineum]